MPYRRLPNTDAARVKALKTAYTKGKEIPPFKLAFSQNSNQKVQSFLPGFEKQIMEYKSGLANQAEKNKDYHNEMKKAKLYISHFIQVMNMAIARGELPKDTRSYFEMEEESKKLPTLNTEKDIIQWGKVLIEGEQKRQMRGLSPITNPTMAVVKVRYENFVEANNFQKTLQRTTALHLDRLTKMRERADEIILQIWNEVEEHLQDEPENIRREKASKYGVVYVYRKNELKNIDLNQVRLNIYQ